MGKFQCFVEIPPARTDAREQPVVVASNAQNNPRSAFPNLKLHPWRGAWHGGTALLMRITTWLDIKGVRSPRHPNSRNAPNETYKTYSSVNKVFRLQDARAEIARLVSYAAAMTGMRKRKRKARALAKPTRVPRSGVVIKEAIICLAAQQECILLSSFLTHTAAPGPCTALQTG